MCGVSGIYNFRSGRPVTAETLQEMSDALRHRGPDDAGLHLDGAAGLALRRLAILDLSPAGHQPLSNEDGTVWIAYNGEVYNHRELRREMEAAGHAYRSTSDTETLVHLYEEAGPAFLERLDGMFGLAVWDTGRRRLLLAVDRIGIKPLFYALTSEGIVFASEMKALLRHPGVGRHIDPGAVDAYLRFGAIPAPSSIFAGVRKLLPGHYLLVTKDGIQEGAYWQPSFQVDGDRTPAQWREEVRALLEESVRERLMSDVPLGAFLSGGVDSSAVVAYMSRAMNRPVDTFAIGFGRDGEVQDLDELRYARLVAERFGADHHEFVVQPELVDALPRIVWHFDEPFANPTAVPFYFLCRMAREHITVALAGVGGDELFGGYPRYLAARYLSLYERVPGPVRGALARAGRLLPPGASEYSVSARVRKFLEGAADGTEGAYLRWMSLFQVEDLDGLYTDAWRAQPGLNGPQAAVWWDAGLEDPMARVFSFDLKTYLPFNLLAYSDRMSMAHSVELRVPFCDHRLVELALAIPPELKANRSGLKVLLKEALQGVLPEEVLWRRKQGFSVPLAQWLRGDLAPTLHNLLSPERVAWRGIFRAEVVGRLVDEHLHSRANHAGRLWSLLVLEVWASLYLDQAHGTSPVPSLADLR